MATREWEIDQRLREITARLVRGEAGAKDMEELNDLQKERVRRMMPFRRHH